VSRRISKQASTVFRVELEMRSRFLKLYEINDPYDFQKLVGILPDRHIQFVRFNERKLVERLRGMGFSPRKVWELLDDVRLLDGDVWATLNFLRTEVGLKNTRRFLEPLDTNEVVVDALEKWAAMWPEAPAKLNSQRREKK
jgi:hypothetical protein